MVPACRDARLVKELVAGVTRQRRRLDFTVAKLTGRNAADLDPALRQVMGGGEGREGALRA